MGPSDPERSLRASWRCCFCCHSKKRSCREGDVNASKADMEIGYGPTRCLSVMSKKARSKMQVIRKETARTRE
jgi:hypothetical protein